MSVAHRHLLRELYARTAKAHAPVAASAVAHSRMAEYEATLFDRQHAILNCWDEFVAVLCTRRAGKSKTVPAKLLKAARRWPGTVLYYLHPDGSTRAEETLLGPDVDMEGVIARYGLPWRYNANKKTFFNTEDGTQIRARGADDMREAKKYRGDKVSEVLLEEAQNYDPTIFKSLVDDVLGPALADVSGQLMAIGTAGEVCTGPWYDVTRNERGGEEPSQGKRKPGWRVFEWSALDNPHMVLQAARVIARKLLPFCDKTQEQLEALLLTPEGRAFCEELAEADPSIMREWFGRWVNDAGALFYAYASQRNDYNGTIPSGRTWLHTMGVDLGHDDSFAIQVWAFSPECEDLYEVANFKAPGMTPAQWAAKVREYQRLWNPVATVVDTGGLGKAIVEEWKTREGLPVEAAEKANKAAYVKLFNSDLLARRVKVLAGGPLAQEMAVLPKDPKSPPHKPPQEHPSYPNHSCDSGLYAWREALHWLGRTPEEQPPPGSPEALQRQADAYEDKRAREVEAARRMEDDGW